MTRWYAFGNAGQSLSGAGLLQAKSRAEAAKLVREYERLWDLPAGGLTVLEFEADTCAQERERRLEENE